METRTDRELMSRVRDGDLGCMADLCRRHSGPLFLHFRRRSASPETAEDLVQETFLRVLKYRSSYRGGSFRAWLLRLARSAASAFFQKAQPIGFSNLREVAEPEDPGPDPTELAERREDLLLLRQALSLLPREQREILILRRFEGLQYRHIADVCRTTEGAARVRCHRALRNLATLYRRLASEQPSQEKRPLTPIPAIRR